MHCLLHLAIAAVLYALAAFAQTPAAFQPPAGIQFEKANIISEGTRMAAEKFSLKSNAGKALPCVLMAHGWGGAMRALRPDALVLAQAGYFVAAFDYRGWGESDSRLLLAAPAPAHKPGETFTAEVREVREVVDPLDFGADWLNAIHWIAGEPMCDMQRLGLWGSSFSGGLVVWAAARDRRVKALHSQVPSLDGRGIVKTDRAKMYTDSTRRARGEIGYPPPLAQEIGKLRGAPIRSRFANYAPVEDVEKAPQCAMQFVLAEKEELFDNKDHGIKAHQRAKGPKNLVTVPNITHYGIYSQARQQAQKLAVEWFDKHLKP
jgi:dienelactone hydrolase